MVSRYMHNPDKGHWVALKWILRYIEGTMDIDLVFEKILQVRRNVSDTLIPTTHDISINTGLQRDMCLHWPK